MAKFFFTFGVGRPYGGTYVEIEADTQDEAREVMHEAHGKKWGFCYPEDSDFKQQITEYGLQRLALIRRNIHGAYKVVDVARDPR